METSSRTATPGEIFLLLKREPPPDVEHLMRVIETAGGRIKHAFLPTALIVEVSTERIGALASLAGVEAVETGPMDEQQWAGAEPEVRIAISVWNQHLRTDVNRGAATGQAWDAPGYLPPDPPAEIREKLRRREQELRSKGT